MKSWPSSALGSLALAALLLALTAPAHAAHHGNPTATPPGPTIPLVTPGSTSCPAVDTSLHGSPTTPAVIPAVSPMASGIFDEPPNMWVGPGDVAHAITIIGWATGSDADVRTGIQSVSVCINGNTVALNATAMSANPRLPTDFGYPFIPTSVGATDVALANMCLYVTPNRGYQRKFCQTINLNNNGTISRGTPYYVNPAGNNANAGTSGSPFASIWYALSSSSPVPDGGLIYAQCPASPGTNTYNEDWTLWTAHQRSTNTMAIEVRPDPATCDATHTYTLTQSSRTLGQNPGDVGLTTIPVQKAYFDGGIWDMSKFTAFSGKGSAQQLVWACDDPHKAAGAGLIDPGGGNGGPYGYPYQDASGASPWNQETFNYTNPQTLSYALDCPLTMITTTGLEGVRNAVETVGWDFEGQYQPNQWKVNVAGTASTPWYQRYTVQDPTTFSMSGATLNGSSNCKVSPNTLGMTVTLTSGTTVKAFSGGGGGGGTEYIAQILTGPAAQLGFLESTSPGATPTINICLAAGTTTANVNGQQILIGDAAHADCNQHAGNQPPVDPNFVVDNMVDERFRCVGNFSNGIYGVQSILAATNVTGTLPGGTQATGTMSSSGTAVTFTSPQSGGSGGGAWTVGVGWCVNIKSGTQVNAYRSITAVTDSQHVTVNAAWSPNLTGENFSLGLPMMNSSIVGGYFDGTGGTQGYLSGCYLNVSLIQVTFTGEASSLVSGTSGSLGLNNCNVGLGCSSGNAGGFGVFGFTAVDSIFDGFTASIPPIFWDYPGPCPACGGNTVPAGLDMDNNRVTRTTGSGVGSANFCGTFVCGTHQTTGTITYSATGSGSSGYKPVTGLSQTLLGDGSNPLFPWAADGTPETLSSLVGAQGQ